MNDYPPDWKDIAKKVKDECGWKCIRCKHPHSREGWRILTVHHLNGDKSNCAWWNLLPLCQRCHLSIQGRVNPNQPYMFEHSDWFKPYVAAFYANKYRNESLTRDETLRQLPELLNLELVSL